MKCKHYKGEGYIYSLGKEDLLLCEQCNINLAQEFLKQLAVEVYCSGPAQNWLTDREVEALSKRIKKLEEHNETNKTIRKNKSRNNRKTLRKN